jgi:hypothetical protein
MTVKPNIGILNALVRITIGFTILSWTTAKFVKRPWRDSYLYLAILAAMKIAEGIVRYCPLTAVFEMWGESEKDKSQRNVQNDEYDEASMLPYNPT